MRKGALAPGNRERVASMKSPLYLAPCLALIASVMVSPDLSYAQQKTAKACEAEWRENKASIQGVGKKKKDFIAECRAQTAQSAAPSTPPAAMPAPGASETAKSEEKPAPEKRRAATARASEQGEFATEAEAKAHCPGDTVVWANTRSKIYHFAGTRTYGKTKTGAYMCEKDTAAVGIRSAKNERRP
jgi:hypothetical protein